MRRSLFVLVPLLMTACTPEAGKPAAAPPCPTTATHREPKAVLADFAQRHQLTPADEPLRHPKTIEDVDAILHLDQIDLFDGASELAAKLPGNDALALHAQIELSHSEAQLLVAEVLGETVTLLTPLVRTLRFRQASGLTTNEERAKLDELNGTLAEAREVASALREQAADHARDGADLTQKLMAKQPDGFRGYRLAADYHRLRGDWKSYAEDLVTLEKLNPKSNGLLFLAALGLQEEGKTGEASRLLQTAIERDNRFVRAQAHLVLLQTTPDAAQAEMEKLKAMNPRHQLVAFAGPFIAAANKAWTEGHHQRPAPWGSSANTL